MHVFRCVLCKCIYLSRLWSFPPLYWHVHLSLSLCVYVCVCACVCVHICMCVSVCVCQHVTAALCDPAQTCFVPCLTAWCICLITWLSCHLSCLRALLIMAHTTLCGPTGHGHQSPAFSPTQVELSQQRRKTQPRREQEAGITRDSLWLNDFCIQLYCII